MILVVPFSHCRSSDVTKPQDTHIEKQKTILNIPPSVTAIKASTDDALVIARINQLLSRLSKATEQNGDANKWPLFLIGIRIRGLCQYIRERVAKLEAGAFSGFISRSGLQTLQFVQWNDSICRYKSFPDIRKKERK